MDSSYIS